jgi:CDP-diacylglycerol--glycerol-3-phosphate 3-phosphatidyltransferase
MARDNKSDRQARRRQKQEARRLRRDSRPPSVLRQEFWNVPNMLTLGRIFIIPVFIWCAYDADPFYSAMAAVLFTVATLTDVVDGYLARKQNLVTVVGKFMDPLADKLLALAAMVMMVRLGRLAAWVAIVALSREFIVTGLRQIAATEGMVIAAGAEGKVKTTLQLVGMVCLCIHYRHVVDFIWWRGPVNFNVVGTWLVYLSLVFSVWSAGLYFRGFLQMLTQREAGQSPLQGA